jgi:hypothetical protein
MEFGYDIGFCNEDFKFIGAIGVDLNSSFMIVC